MEYNKFFAEKYIIYDLYQIYKNLYKFDISIQVILDQFLQKVK